MIALLSIKAGLRAKEIAGLLWSHLTDPEGNLADELVIDDRTAKGKNGGRTIPINKDLKKALAELKDVIQSEPRRPVNPGHSSVHRPKLPQAGLAPLEDIFDLARLQAFNSYLCSTVHVAHAHRHRGNRWADDPAAIAAMRRKVPQTVGACFKLIESEMFEGPWLMGETYSLCDPYFYTVARWLKGDKVDTTKLPKTMAHMRRMEARPAVNKVLDNPISVKEDASALRPS